MQGRWVGPGCRQGRSFVRGVFVMLYVMCRIFCWLRCQKWNTNVQPNNDGIIVVRPLGCRSPLIGICMVANAIADPISFARRKKTPKPEVSKTNEIAMPTKNHSQQRKATYLPQRILQVMTLRLEYLQLGQLFRFLQHMERALELPAEGTTERGVAGPKAAAGVAATARNAIALNFMVWLLRVIRVWNQQIIPALGPLSRDKLWLMPPFGGGYPLIISSTLRQKRTVVRRSFRVFSSGRRKDVIQPKVFVR